MKTNSYTKVNTNVGKYSKILQISLVENKLFQIMFASLEICLSISQTSKQIENFCKP